MFHDEDLEHLARTRKTVEEIDQTIREIQAWRGEQKKLFEQRIRENELMVERMQQDKEASPEWQALARLEAELEAKRVLIESKAPPSFIQTGSGEKAGHLTQEYEHLSDRLNLQMQPPKVEEVIKESGDKDESGRRILEEMKKEPKKGYSW